MEHIDSEECWCEPILYHTTKNGQRILVHRELSGKFNGDTPPIDVLIEAILQASYAEGDGV